MMKKVLILSCSTGQGHNSCAQAIKEYFEKQGVECVVCDALDFVSVRVAHMISRGHSWMYRYAPDVFRWGYKYSERHPGVFEGRSTVHRMLALGVERMRKYMSGKGFDTVICTHVFSAMMLTEMLHRHPRQIQTAFVGTDYTCHPGTEAGDLQWYFIPHDSMAGEYVADGIPQEKLYTTGIPVRPDFCRHTEKDDAKRLLGVEPGRMHLLVMCGSMGCGPMKKIVHRIARKMPDDMEMTVVCGTNHKLEASLLHRYGGKSGIHVVGYTNQIPLYLDSADLYLTKPGGISVTEAAMKKVPMAFVNAVDGCEGPNLRFFVEMGAAVTAVGPVELAQESLRVLHSPEARAEMVRALCEYDQPNGAARIFEKLNGGTTA